MLLITRTWEIDGVKREALVVLPKHLKGAPVMFAFHGRGGKAHNAWEGWRLHKYWPEAIVIYPQGGHVGWRPHPDVVFFEAMCETARAEWKCSKNRIYAVGHSNGGAFVYYLWGQYPMLFAALSSASARGADYLGKTKPCPILIVGAKNDDVVPWRLQEEAIHAARQVNGTSAPVALWLHTRKHAYVEQASKEMVAFFKKYPKRNQ